MVLGCATWYKWSYQRVFKTMRSWFPIFWQLASSFSTWFCSNSKWWSADLDIIYETLRWMNPHLLRFLSSIFHTNLMSSIQSPFPSMFSHCPNPPMALILVLVFHLLSAAYRYSHSISRTLCGPKSSIFFYVPSFQWIFIPYNTKILLLPEYSLILRKYL